MTELIGYAASALVAVSLLTSNVLRNFGGATCGGTVFESFVVSCNTTFAKMGLDLGDRFPPGLEGFGVEGEAPPLDVYPGAVRNTGLEGARVGDSSGKALVAVADEVRSLSSRGLDIVASHVRLMEDAEAEQQKLLQAAELAQAQAMELAAQLRQAHETQCDTISALTALEKNIERVSGFDANAAADLQRVAEHGRGLISALESLSVSRRQRLVKSLLLPTIEPLLETLLDEAQLRSWRERGEPKP